MKYFARLAAVAWAALVLASGGCGSTGTPLTLTYRPTAFSSKYAEIAEIPHNEPLRLEVKDERPSEGVGAVDGKACSVGRDAARSSLEEGLRRAMREAGYNLVDLSEVVDAGWYGSARVLKVALKQMTVAVNGQTGDQETTASLAYEMRAGGEVLLNGTATHTGVGGAGVGGAKGHRGNWSESSFDPLDVCFSTAIDKIATSPAVAAKTAAANRAVASGPVRWDGDRYNSIIPPLSEIRKSSPPPQAAPSTPRPQSPPAAPAVPTPPPSSPPSAPVPSSPVPLAGEPGPSPAAPSIVPPPAADPAPESAGHGSRWAVVVGISKYHLAGQGELGNLAFADEDATGFAKALEDLGWSPDHVRVLLNEQATKQALSYTLETWLRHAGRDDEVVVFWSGHGWPDPEDPEKAFFACYDSKPSDPSSGMRMDHVRRAIEERRPRNVVVVADTCHAGKIIRGRDPKGLGVVPALEAMQRWQTLPPGWVFVASADPDRKAYEDKAWKHGALTHVLLEGMAGKADGYKSTGKKDGVVTMGELRTYIIDRMADESLTVLGARLLPLFYTTSGDPAIWDLDLRGK